MTETALIELPRIAVGAEDAAAALGVSRRFFLDTIAPDLRCIRVGRRKLWRLAELERWAEANEARTLDR